MLEHLWNGWRSTYVTSGGAAGGVADDDVASGRGSVFSRILHSGLPDVDTHIVHRGEHCFAILNAFPYSVGHVLVLPYREVADLEALDTDETTELWRTVTDAVVAVKNAYRPEGVNVGVNLGRPAGGSVSDHLHVHVVPALDRRRQLHDRHGEHAHAAGGAPRHRHQGAGVLAGARTASVAWRR